MPPPMRPRLLSSFPMPRLLLCFVALVWAVGAHAAEPRFPRLEGRVTDQAGMLSTGARQSLESALAEHERKTGQQIVVVSVKSLEGVPIEQYGYRLGRAWGIGEKGRNTGALLIVAPDDRQVRIEVGYGLEGTLTDALSSVIINRVMLPRFREGEMEEGVLQGAAAILSTLRGADVEVGGRHAPQRLSAEKEGVLQMLAPMIFIFLIFFLIPRLSGRRSSAIAPIILGGMMGRGGRGGGFRGGGGSFGGGGASGRW